MYSVWGWRTNSFDEALSSANESECIAAIRGEITSMENNQFWESVDLPSDKNLFEQVDLF